MFGQPSAHSFVSVRAVVVQNQMQSRPLWKFAVQATEEAQKFLDALENEQWDKLPGGVFGRGFVRSIARYLGLSEENLLSDYDLARGETGASGRRGRGGRCHLQMACSAGAEPRPNGTPRREARG